MSCSQHENCPCDKVMFPPERAIHAGLDTIPRQIALFTDFRNAMLSKIRTMSTLHSWRGREMDDAGIMLIEMWSYLCDVVSFYDEVIANESYIRTAKLRSSLRKLTGLLGYIPIPAVGSIAKLAVLAEGFNEILIPEGTAFRSGMWSLFHI